MTEIEAIHAVISSQEFSKSMLTGEDESHKMEKETFLHVISSDDLVTRQSSNSGNLGKENLVFDANKETKAEMLEECFESEETSKKKEAKEAKAAESSGHANGIIRDEQQEKSKVIGDKLYVSNPKKENNLVLDKQNRMPSYQRLTHSRSLKTGNSLLGKSGNMPPCQNQNSRLPKSSVITTKSSIQSGKDRVLAFTNKGSRPDENVEVTSATSKSLLHKKSSPGSTRQNYTVPQPFSLATDKRASFGSQQTGSEAAPKHSRRASTSNVTSPLAGKKQLTAKTASGVLETKISHSIAHKPSTPTEASKSRTSIVAASTVTISRCNERAEKRKEFNTKLDEKLHAKEEERRQLQAKTKEQQEEQLKKMRRSLSFKANPIPDFYHEAIPPKIDSKKVPPTRVKSPKLGQRKSIIGVESEDNHNEDTNGDLVHKTPPKVGSAVKKTMPNVSTKTPTSSKRKSISREPITPKQETLGMPETGYSHVSTENGNVVTDELLHSSESPINEEKSLQQGDCVKQENEVEPLNRQSLMLDSNIEVDLTLKSENDVAVDDIAALMENLQVSVDSN